MAPTTLQKICLQGFIVTLLLAASTTFAVLMKVDLDPRVDFELTNQHGRRMSEADFEGKYALAYFGFTHCAAICPAQMTKVSAIVNALGGRLDELPVVPVFLSVDPERDSVARVREYVGRFHPDFVGLTGERSELERAASSFRSALAPKESGGAGYQVAHPAVLYLVGPDSRLLAHIPFAASTADSLARIRELVL